MGLEPGLGLIPRPFLAANRLVGGDDLPHFFLDGREILGRKRLGAIKIVVKAVLDHRADGDLGAGIKRLDRVGQHMGGVVADEFQRARVFAVQKFDLGVGADGRRGVHHIAVEHHGDGLFGQRGGNASGDVEAGGAGLEGTRRAIGKSDRNHPSLLAHSPRRAGVSGLRNALVGESRRKRNHRGLRNRLWRQSRAARKFTAEGANRLAMATALGIIPA